MRDVDSRALLEQFSRGRGIERRPDPPSSTYLEFKPARPLSDWVHDGKIDEGSEPSGTVFRFDVIAAMNAARKSGNPCEFVVIGERRYSDGRAFLDVAINPAWVRETSPYRFIDGRWQYVCPDCGGRGESHNKVSVPSPANPGRNILAKCPRDTARARR